MHGILAFSVFYMIKSALKFYFLHLTHVYQWKPNCLLHQSNIKIPAESYTSKNNSAHQSEIALKLSTKSSDRMQKT